MIVHDALLQSYQTPRLFIRATTKKIYGSFRRRAGRSRRSTATSAISRGVLKSRDARVRITATSSRTQRLVSGPRQRVSGSGERTACPFYDTISVLWRFTEPLWIVGMADPPPCSGHTLPEPC